MRTRDVRRVEVTETSDAVAIRVEVVSQWGPQAVPLEVATAHVALDEPLGDRTLEGCERHACGAFSAEYGCACARVELVDGRVLIVRDDATTALDAVSGDVVPAPDEVPGYEAGDPPQDATVLVGDRRLRTEPTGLFLEEEGEVVWSRSLLPATLPHVVGSFVVLGVRTDSPDDLGSLELWGLDLASGELAWQQPLAGDAQLTVTSQHIVTTAADHEVEIRAVDGELLHRTTVHALVGGLLADDERAYVAIAGQGAAAIDLATGEVDWWYSQTVEAARQ